MKPVPPEATRIGDGAVRAPLRLLGPIPRSGPDYITDNKFVQPVERGRAQVAEETLPPSGSLVVLFRPYCSAINKVVQPVEI